VEEFSKMDTIFEGQSFSWHCLEVIYELLFLKTWAFLTEYFFLSIFKFHFKLVAFLGIRREF